MKGSYIWLENEYRLRKGCDIKGVASMGETLVAKQLWLTLKVIAAIIFFQVFFSPLLSRAAFTAALVFHTFSCISLIIFFLCHSTSP